MLQSSTVSVLELSTISKRETVSHQMSHGRGRSSKSSAVICWCLMRFFRKNRKKSIKSIAIYSIFTNQSKWINHLEKRNTQDLQMICCVIDCSEAPTSRWAPKAHPVAKKTQERHCARSFGTNVLVLEQTRDKLNGRRESKRGKRRILLSPMPITTELWLFSHRIRCSNNHRSVVIWIGLSGVLRLRRFDSLRPFINPTLQG